MRRRAGWSTVVLAPLLLVPAGGPHAQDSDGYRPPPGWPTCDERQAEVVLLELAPQYCPVGPLPWLPAGGSGT